MTFHPKRILITSVSAGSGHVRAAQAIEAAMKRAHPYLDVQHVDLMDYVSGPFRHFYVDGYAFAVNHAPALWGQLYRRTDHPAGKLPPIIASVQARHATGFFDFLERFDPDLILTTHFLVPQILSSRSWKRRVPVGCVVTDYDLHTFWVNPLIDRYYVAREMIAEKLRLHGVAATRIVISGIPVHPSFIEHPAKSAAIKKLGLEPEMKTILLMSGGFGFGSLDKTVEALFQLEQPLQILTVSGRNHQLRSRLERLTPPPHVKLRNFGFVGDMEDFLSAADLVVTKPGGLTVSECLVTGCAMVLYSPIPGQEEANAEYVQQIGAGIKADSAPELVEAIRNLLISPALVSKMASNAIEQSRPRAAYTIADLAVSSLNPS